MRFSKDFGFVVLLLALTVLFFWEVFLHPGFMLYSPQSDLLSATFNKVYMVESLKNFGELPLWADYVFSGSNFAGNPISYMFYPFNVFFLLFPVEPVFGFLTALHVFMAGLFTYLFARTIKLSRFGSFVAAVIFMFSGKFFAHIYAGHLTMVFMMAYLPLILLLFELALQKRSCLFAVLTGVAMSLQFLVAHFQIFLYSSFFLFLYFLFRTYPVFRKEKNAKTAALFTKFLVLAIIVCALLSAIQLLPSYEYSKNFGRTGGAGYDYAASYSLGLKNIIMLVSPYHFGDPMNYSGTEFTNFWEMTSYVGILPLILALVGVCFVRKKNVAFFCGTALFSFLFALGKNGPLFWFFYYFIPGFNMFRVPSRMLFFFAFSVAMLAAFGTDFLSMRFKEKIKRTLFKSVVALVIIADLFVFAASLIDVKSPDEIFKPTETINFLQSDNGYRVFSLSYFALPKHSFRRYGIEEVEDHFSQGSSRYNNYMQKIVLDTGDYYNHDGIVYIENPQLLDLLNVKYVLSLNDLVNRTALKEVIEAGMLEYRHRITELENSTSKDAYMERNDTARRLKIKESYIERIVSGAYSDSMEEKLRLRFMASNGDSVLVNGYDGNYTVYIYENKDVLPRAFVVRNATIARNSEAALQTVSHHLFDFRKSVVLEKDIDKPLSNEGELKPAEITFYSPNRLRVKVDLENPGFLVLSEIWSPGWKAFNNKKELEVYRADYLFRAVYLEAGQHEVEFVYKPWSYTAGKTISCLAAFALIIYFLVYFVLARKKNRKPNQPT